MTSRRSLWLMHGHPDTPEQIAERVRYNAAHAQAVREGNERFANATVDELIAARDWVLNRVAEILAA